MVSTTVREKGSLQVGSIRLLFPTYASVMSRSTAGK
jgi:hypothetical protein